MKKTIRWVILGLVVIVLGTVGYRAFDQQTVFQGDKVKNQDCYLLHFKKMNQLDSHELTLEQGDRLSVEFAVEYGHADLLIGMPGEKEIYRGNDLDKGAFELTAPQAGTYQVTVDAKHASGFLEIHAYGKDEK